jgi:dGTP triphosphohydrolase
MRRARDSEHELGEAGRSRAVADYVAGMTDRYALSAYARLTGADLKSATALQFAGEDDEQP